MKWFVNLLMVTLFAIVLADRRNRPNCGDKNVLCLRLSKNKASNGLNNFWVKDNCVIEIFAIENNEGRIFWKLDGLAVMDPNLGNPLIARFFVSKNQVTKFNSIIELFGSVHNNQDNAYCRVRFGKSGLNNSAPCSYSVYEIINDNKRNLVLFNFASNSKIICTFICRLDRL